MRRTFKQLWRQFTKPYSRSPRLRSWQPRLESLEDRLTPAPNLLNPAPPGVISGLVFVDSNGNTLRDAGEAALPGVSITLSGTPLQGASVNQSATTDTNGAFRFLQVPAGTYQLTRAAIGSFAGDTSSAGSLGGIVAPSTISNISVSPGEAGLNFLFGVRGLSPRGLSLAMFLNVPSATSLPVGQAGGGQAFADGSVQPLRAPAAGARSLSGAVLNGQVGLTNIQVTLSGVDDAGQALFRTSSTSSLGAFTFSSLRAGTYVLSVPVQPEGFRTGSPTVGSIGGIIQQNNVISSIQVGSTNGTGYNFVVIPSAAPQAGPGPAIAAELLHDTAGPALTGGTNSDGITANVTIQGRIIASAAITSLSAAFDSSTSFTSILGQLNANGRFLLNKSVLAGILGSSLDNRDLVGKTLHLRATDALGRTGSFDLVFVVDNVAPESPTLSLDAANDDGHGRTTDASVTLRGHTSPGAHVALIGSTTLEALADGNGDFQFSGVSLNNGQNDFTVRATDGAGNFSELATIVVRNRAPSAGTQANISGARGSAERVLDLSALFSDPDFANTVLSFNTSGGAINVSLLDAQKPQTVANFMNYVNDGAYARSFFHRSVTDFVLQGGGFTFHDDANHPVPEIHDVVDLIAVKNEFVNDPAFFNTTGSIAMAKLSSGPDPQNSATNQFYFNLNNNTSLDSPSNNGGFTVFGKVLTGDDLRRINTLAAIPTQDQSDANSAFTDLPLKDYTGTQFPQDAASANFALVNAISILKQAEALTFALDPSIPITVAEIQDNNRLVLHFTTAGTTTISVTAIDKSGQTATLTFTFTVT